MKIVSVTFTQCFHRMHSWTCYRHHFLGLCALLKGTIVMFQALLLAGIKPALWLNHHVTPPQDVWGFNNSNVLFLQCFLNYRVKKKKINRMAVRLLLGPQHCSPCSNWCNSARKPDQYQRPPPDWSTEVIPEGAPLSSPRSEGIHMYKTTRPPLLGTCTYPTETNCATLHMHTEKGEGREVCGFHDNYQRGGFQISDCMRTKLCAFEEVSCPRVCLRWCVPLVVSKPK